MQLSRANLLASYPDREEFQCDRTIVWVQISTHGDRNQWLLRAEHVFEEIWSAMPTILIKAEAQSRFDFPAVWRQFDTSRSQGQPLMVYGIWIDPVNLSALYSVAENPDFQQVQEGSGTIQLPDDYTVWIQRNCGGELVFS